MNLTGKDCMTNQDKLLKQVARVVLRMAEDVDFLLGRVHEFGPHKRGNQAYVARRTVALRANVDSLRSGLGLKPRFR
jgi:hypothetical protein